MDNLLSIRQVHNLFSIVNEVVIKLLYYIKIIPDFGTTVSITRSFIKINRQKNKDIFKQFTNFDLDQDPGINLFSRIEPQQKWKWKIHFQHIHLISWFMFHGAIAERVVWTKQLAGHNLFVVISAVNTATFVHPGQWVNVPSQETVLVAMPASMPVPNTLSIKIKKVFHALTLWKVNAPFVVIAPGHVKPVRYSPVPHLYPGP